jgi:hypothetical protein
MSARNAPKWFTGTAEEQRRNIDSHTWVLVDHCRFFGLSGPVDPPESLVCAECGTLDGFDSHCDDRFKPDFLNRYWLDK